SNVMQKRHLAAILLYGCPREDPEFPRMLLGTAFTSPLYVLITPREQIVFCNRWRVDDLRPRSTIKKFVGCAGQDDLIQQVLKKIGKHTRIGYAGLAPYNHLKNITAQLVDVSDDLVMMSIIKSPYELALLRKTTQTLSLAMHATPAVGDTEKDVAAKIRARASSADDIQLNITAGPRLKKTTCAVPSNYKLKKGDIVCIDCVISINGYHADLTRCISVGKNNNFKYYQQLCNAHEAVIQKLTPGANSSAIHSMYRKELARYGLAKYFVPLDTGHGIGFGRHEPPDIGEDHSVLQPGTVFTLEPEINLGTIRLRVEDMIIMTKHGAKKIS
ncbi:MAG TPA: M24 family metallopeptidase, partial [Candidatus Binatia bacterium]|nr:M24 family metallopeptidase [Candidatus Binatia bacterium]